MSTAEAAADTPLARATRGALPLSAYVHLPWCVRKCPYCDFNSHRAPPRLPERAYIDAVIADWRYATRDEPRPIETVFFGGGTPSLFSAAAIERVLTALDTAPGLAGGCEITLEANPGASDRAHFAALRAAGVNRLSLGIQSFDDDCLRALGRIHDANLARAAIDAARAAGFEALNCDLMYGLPGQTPAMARADIERLLALEPGHISYYQLTLEPNTPFNKNPPALPAHDRVADIFDAARERLAAAGYARYEVSAWARRGAACRHNDNYWRFGDYIGIGAGAHGKRTRADGAIERTARLKWPAGFMQAAGRSPAVTHRRILDRDDARFECLLGGLRRHEGLARDDYAWRTGLSWPALLEHLRAPVADGLLVADGRGVRASRRGWDFLDTILADIAP